jgi:dynein heavy chain
MTPEQLKMRVHDLTESITFQGFNFTRRGTLEDDKLILSTMLCFRILIRQGKVLQNEYDALIKKELAADPPLQAESLKFLPETAWAAVKGLENLKSFDNLSSQMESEALLWRKWYIDERPESCDLPKSVANISLFHRTLLLRAMRPDRLTYALREFVQENLGLDYVEQQPFDILATMPEMNPITPTFFVLFPGVNPVPEIEAIAKTAGKTEAEGSFIYISMGQGQEERANKKLKEAGKAGYWALFANVHLMADWMKVLERNFEIVHEEGAHPDFRLFLTSEPPPLPLMEIIPESILQNALKVANEAPRDIKSNIKRAFSKFPQADFERAKTHKEQEFKALLFGLCMFHSLILGRTKFGSQGWSRKYDFNDGDLRICGDILHNYLTKYEQVPFRDLQYLYGEIMYGGHITDNWDRRTNETYLAVLMRKEILDNMQLTLSQGFRSPPPLKMPLREDYITFVDEKLPPEVPQMFGLHPNAEIGYLTTLGEKLAFTILSCSGGGSAGSGGKDDIVKEKIVRFLAALPEPFNMIELDLKAKDRTPYVVVCLQESERMNTLMSEVKSTLEDLDAGLKGSLNITEDMEELGNSLFLNTVPAAWIAVAYPSLKDLATWFDDLLLRIAQLAEYGEELIVPKSLWISALFNPMSFLTAIMQVTARAHGLALDDMTLQTDVTNIRDPLEIAEAANGGAYVHGYYVQGAAWEPGRGSEQGNLQDMIPKELSPELPVMHVTAIVKSNQATLGFYMCPVYITSARGATYVTTAYLKMESEEADPKKWILAGVALIMQPE